MRRYRTKELMAMPTERLEELLRAEFAKRPLDDKLVRKALEILEERKPAPAVELSREEVAAWKEFTQRCKQTENATQKGSVAGRKKIIWISAIAASLCLLVFAMPPVFGANNVVDLFQQVSCGIIKIFHPGNANEGYVFETDNPGLQELYDTVTELGVTEPVVPMWLPEGYELEEIKINQTPAKVRVISSYACGDRMMSLCIDMVGSETVRTIEADYPDAKPIDLGGRVFYMNVNAGNLMVAWDIGDALCFLQTNEDEEVCKSILQSIYRKAVS